MLKENKFYVNLKSVLLWVKVYCFWSIMLARMGINKVHGLATVIDGLLSILIVLLHL